MTRAVDPDLVRAARAWIEGDPDPETRGALERALESGDTRELELCFAALEFGTAGLRAVEGAGPGRMNSAVVIRAARGLADYLWRREPDAAKLPVVVGYDARRNSERYARLVIQVLVAARLEVRYFPFPVATPLVAYAAREYGAQAALCITASHNPPEYAGLKVFDGNAVQIVTPKDREISAAISAVGLANRVPLAEWPARASADEPGAHPIDELLIERYQAELAALRTRPRSESSLRIVYTALHGVGGEPMLDALRRAGYHLLHPVPEQFTPDPAFPTLAFPNPEEPGALDLAITLAKSVAADLVLAHDPDADRLAACVPASDGEYRVLSGNELGVLLGDHLLERWRAGPKPLVVSSIVSTPMIESVARRRGAESVRTLTGFKWMYNAAIALERERGWRLCFGYEEALGYSVAGPVRDKDGLSAGLVFADLVAEAAERGRSVEDELAELYRAHGLWQSWLETVLFERTPEALARAAAAVARLRAAPPSHLESSAVSSVIDYLRDAAERPWYLGEADLLEFRLERGARVLVRPSGTEPKLKIYADYRAELQPEVPLPEQEASARERARDLAQAVADLLR